MKALLKKIRVAKKILWLLLLTVGMSAGFVFFNDWQNYQASTTSPVGTDGSHTTFFLNSTPVNYTKNYDGIGGKVFGAGLAYLGTKADFGVGNLDISVTVSPTATFQSAYLIGHQSLNIPLDQAFFTQSPGPFYLKFFAKTIGGDLKGSADATGARNFGPDKESSIIIQGKNTTTGAYESVATMKKITVPTITSTDQSYTYEITFTKNIANYTDLTLIFWTLTAVNNWYEGGVSIRYLDIEYGTTPTLMTFNDGCPVSGSQGLTITPDPSVCTERSKKMMAFTYQHNGAKVHATKNGNTYTWSVATRYADSNPGDHEWIQRGGVLFFLMPDDNCQKGTFTFSGSAQIATAPNLRSDDTKNIVVNCPGCSAVSECTGGCSPTEPTKWCEPTCELDTKTYKECGLSSTLCSVVVGKCGQTALAFGPSQSIGLGQTPSAMTATGGTAPYTFEFTAGATGLVGNGSGSTFTFTGAAKANGTATITAKDAAGATQTATVEVSSSPLSATPASQTVSIGKLPQNITASGGSKTYSFSFDDGGTWLKGAGSGSTFAFTGYAGKDGTATVKITDTVTNATQEAKIIVSTPALTVSPATQTITVLQKPSGITVSGGSGSFVFSLDAGNTGLSGTAGINTYTFSSIATQPGTATLTVTDKLDSTKTGTATVIVKSLPLKSFTISLLNCDSAIPALVGDTCTLTASGTFSDGSTKDISDEVIWRGTEQLGTLSGNVLAIEKAGATTISASIVINDAGEKMASLNTVSLNAIDAGALISLQISSTCTQGVAALDDVCALKAMGTYEDGTVRDISDQVSWVGTESIGTLEGYYLTITKEGRANLTANFENPDGERVVSNVIAIATEKSGPIIRSIRTTGNASAAEGTHETLYIEVENIYGLGDLNNVEISLVKGQFCRAEDVPPTAQIFDIVETGVAPRISFPKENSGLMEVPILIPIFGDLHDGKYTILVRLYNQKGDYTAAAYSYFIGVPATGDVNYDGSYSLADAIMVMKFYSQTATPTTLQLTGADFDVNGKVDLLDVIGVFRRVIDTQNGVSRTMSGTCSVR